MLSTKKDAALQEIMSYTIPEYREGKDCHIAFYAFSPADGKMKRKKIRLNHIGGKTARKKYASALVHRLTMKLEEGWNPWIEAENSMAYHTLESVSDRYCDYLKKLYNDDGLREHTLYDYQNKLRMLLDWNRRKKIPITYVYQLDRRFINDFLDYIYIERGNSIRTRNNYLVWMKVFTGWLVQRAYLKENPTNGIISIKQRGHQKDRDVISEPDMVRLSDYLDRKNKYFKLACYLLHYVFIRPKEMANLRLKDFSLQKQTILISGEYSKNRKSETVTLPKKVIMLMLELNIFDNPSHYYLFSKDFKPGEVQKSEKNFRDFWQRHVRRDLGFSIRYKFYSLKDTGITNMLKSCDAKTVRDQARHSNIAITDIYTPHDIKEANELLLNYEGRF
nr:MAG TPA: Integrase [Caudoviricetes sp.]